MVCRWIFRTRGKFSLKYRSPEAEKKKWQIWRMYTPTANESILRAARKSDEMLEPYEWKRSRTVLRREGASNRPDLVDCQPKPAGRERTPPAFPEGPQYNPPEVYQPAGDTGGKCGGHSKRAGTAIRLLGRGGTAQEPSCSFGRGSRYRGRSGKCTLIHTQRHGRDFMRSSFIWARRAVGVPDC